MAVRKRFWTLLARREGRFLPEFGSFVRGEPLPHHGRIDAAAGWPSALQPAGALTHRLHHNYGDLNSTNDRSNAPGSLGQ
jgi:hypothetical protein